MKIAAIAKAKANPLPPANVGPAFQPGSPDAAPVATEEQPAAPILPSPGQPTPAPVGSGNGSAPAAPAVDLGAKAQPVEAVAMIQPGNPSGPASPGVTVAKTGGILMRGAQAHTAVATEQAKADLAASQSGFRFWIKPGQEARITFIDGHLDADGVLSIPYWYEHRLMISGRVQNITCYETVPDMGPCPICASGHRTQLVAGMSMINHTPYTVQSGQNAGKTLTHRRQMFVAPRTAVQTMQQLAGKRGGLSQHCFDVYRKEKKDPRVGSVFDYVGQLTAEQCAGFGEEWKPFDWDEQIVLLEAADMAKYGGIAVPYGGGGQGATADLDEIEV